MKIRKEDLREEPKTSDNGILQTTGDAYRTFNDWVAFRENDPMWLLILKLVGRVFGILIMVILSPFIVIGLAIAFAAVL